MGRYIEALLEERQRVERAGLSRRVALVDAELRRVGYQTERPKKTARRKKATLERADVAAPEQAVPERPQRRPSQ